MECIDAERSTAWAQTGLFRLVSTVKSCCYSRMCNLLLFQHSGRQPVRWQRLAPTAGPLPPVELAPHTALVLVFWLQQGVSGPAGMLSHLLSATSPPAFAVPAYVCLLCPPCRPLQPPRGPTPAYWNTFAAENNTLSPPVPDYLLDAELAAVSALLLSWE